MKKIPDTSALRIVCAAIAAHSRVSTGDLLALLPDMPYSTVKQSRNRATLRGALICKKIHNTLHWDAAPNWLEILDGSKFLQHVAKPKPLTGRERVAHRLPHQHELVSCWAVLPSPQGVHA